MPPIAKALGVTLTITTTTAHHGRVRREYDRECFGSAASWRLEEALRGECTKSLVESEIFDRTLRLRFPWLSVRSTAFYFDIDRSHLFDRAHAATAQLQHRLKVSVTACGRSREKSR